MTNFPVEECLRLWREDLKDILAGRGTPCARPRAYKRYNESHREFMFRTASEHSRIQARICDRLQKWAWTQQEIADVWGFTKDRVYQLLLLAKDMQNGEAT